MCGLSLSVLIAGSNTVSTAEQTILCILSIVRNYPVGYSQIVNGGWDLAEVSNKAYDIEDKVVGIVGGGRIGQLVMQRLKVQSDQIAIVHNAERRHKNLLPAQALLYPACPSVGVLATLMYCNMNCNMNELPRQSMHPENTQPQPEYFWMCLRSLLECQTVVHSPARMNEVTVDGRSTSG